MHFQIYINIFMYTLMQVQFKLSLAQKKISVWLVFIRFREVRPGVLFRSFIIGIIEIVS